MEAFIYYRSSDLDATYEFHYENRIDSYCFLNALFATYTDLMLSSHLSSSESRYYPRK